VILSLNEQINIADCLASCCWSDDVHLLDSGSEDDTRDLAQRMGAHVHVNPFESFGRQRNWAIDNIPLKHDWVFHLDADERFTPGLVAEIDRVIARDPPEACFHVPSKLMFMGKWLKRAGGYPTYQVRLFHKCRMRFADHGHGQREQTNGTIGLLESPYLHFSFAKGLYDWFDKHNRYSTLEALQIINRDRRRTRLSALFIGDPIARRRMWKEVSLRVPFWPLIRWGYTMFVLGAILEGRPGWSYARLVGMYEQMTLLKLRVLRRGRRFEADRTPTPSTRAYDAGDRVQGPPTPGRTEPPTARPEQEPRTDDLGQTLPESSPWTLGEKVFRVMWMLVGRPVFRLSFHNWYPLRASLLRLFGARIGRGVRLRPSVHVEIPWNIDLADNVVVGDHAILYSLGTITVGPRTVISQYAHLCAGTHDFADRRFRLIRDPIVIGRDAWIGADAFIGPNVRVGEFAVVGARASVYKNLDPGMVYAGNPAKPIKKRQLR